MAERPDNPEPSTTVVDNEHTLEDDEPLTLRLKLRKPASKKKVRWISGTVDNENDNKKKSKCCCIYHKPLEFGESSSESDGECENCFGHVELKKKKSDSKIPPPGPSEEEKPNKDSENNGDLNPEEATPQES